MWSGSEDPSSPRAWVCVLGADLYAPVSPLSQDNAVITLGCSCPLSLVYRLCAIAQAWLSIQTPSRPMTFFSSHMPCFPFFYFLFFNTLQIGTSRKSGYVRRQEVGWEGGVIVARLPHGNPTASRAQSNARWRAVKPRVLHVTLASSLLTTRSPRLCYA